MKDIDCYNAVIDRAIEVLLRGGMLLYPTDTIWGLGCDASNAVAVERVYAVKHRDLSKSMLVLCSDLVMVERLVGRVGEKTAALLLSSERPTTVIMRCDSNMLARNLVAADGTVGVRIPRMAFCQTLLQRFGKPIVSTSANLSGKPSPTTFADIDSKLMAQADYCVPASFEVHSDGCGSRIVKVNDDGEILVIRP